ncbi:hypothetical protein GCM10010359_24100 [Streptomyces morookaense]|nr:hypothetical protein GCM10010359_24100 [Streptomyces morookaense]
MALSELGPATVAARAVAAELAELLGQWQEQIAAGIRHMQGIGESRVRLHSAARCPHSPDLWQCCNRDYGSAHQPDDYLSDRLQEALPPIAPTAPTIGP